MRKRLLLIFIIWSLSLNGFTQTPFSAEADSLILRGMDLTFFSHYDSAMSVFRQVSGMYPDHLAGFFYQAATLQSKMMDYEMDLWEDDFYKVVDEVIEMGHVQVDEGSLDPWTYLYMGSAYGYKGLYQIKAGSYLSGFINARKGLSYLRKAMTLDSNLYDAYLGLGNYYYWSCSMIGWLPWVKDRRDEGIRMIQKAVDQGTFSYWVGINALGWIEYDRHEYQSSLELFQRGLKQYPGSRFFLWGVADSYFRKADFENARFQYLNLLKSIQASPMENGFNEIHCYLRLAASYFGLKMYEEAYHECIYILKHQTDDKTARRLKKHYETAESLRIQCLDALGRRTVIRE